MAETYTERELLDMLHAVKEQHGKVTPRLFNAMDQTCSASTVMRRFGTWEDAKIEAGISEDLSGETGRNRQYTDGDVLRHIRQCAERNDGKATVALMNQEEDLVAPSVAVERFGSWSKAKQEAGLKSDARADNHRPRKYSDEDYYELLRECEERHGKVTQSVFDEDDEFPSSGAVAQRFESWEQAKKMAGIETDAGKYSDEELLEMMLECKRRYENCSADRFAEDDDFAAPETLQRRFGSWNGAKEAAKEFEENGVAGTV